MLKLALGLILGAGVCYGADSPAASAYRDFRGGLNDYEASVSIPANESPNLMNVSIDEEPGALVQRNGYLSCGVIPGGSTATNLYEYAKQNGTRYLIVTNNESVWQTADCVTYSTITTGLSATALPRFATVRDNLWIVNGSTFPITWNGTTATRLDGLSGRPTAPRGKYITYWKNRVWIANTPTDPSILNFTSLVDATGLELDPATSTGAWLATNAIYFNRGEVLYGIKVYRDNLYAFSEDAISRLVFESEFTAGGIQVTKNVSKIGSKFQESIVEMDDSFLRFAGRDGVYMFDGSTVKRLSTKWTPTYESIKQPAIAESFKSWDSQTDFDAGTVAQTSTTIQPGATTLGYQYDDFTDGDYTSGHVWTPITGTWAVTDYVLNKTGTTASEIRTPSKLAAGTWSFNVRRNGSSSFNVVFMQPDAVASVYNALFVNSVQTTLETRNKSGVLTTICNMSYVQPAGSTQHYTITRTNSGNFTVVSGTASCSGTDITVTSSSYFSVNGSGVSGIGSGISSVTGLGYFSTGTFTSEISTATSISAWRTFDIDQTLNGQSITYDIRTGTSVYNVGVAPWVTITPGAVVSTTTNGFAQWRANFTTTDNSVTPLLNSASLGWLTGGSSKSALYGIRYKSRYWLAGSTTTANDYNDITMVESKAGLYTWTRHNLPLSAMTVWNGNLYGAIGNTAKIARLDYGSTDDGAAIVSYWDSRDEIYENPILFKVINRQIADFASTPANSGVKIGLSNDFGATWAYKTLNTGLNANLVRNTRVINQNANRALQFRSRVYNDTLGIGFKFYGVHSFGTVSDFIGN